MLRDISTPMYVSELTEASRRRERPASTLTVMNMCLQNIYFCLKIAISKYKFCNVCERSHESRMQNDRTTSRGTNKSMVAGHGSKAK